MKYIVKLIQKDNNQSYTLYNIDASDEKDAVEKAKQYIADNFFLPESKEICKDQITDIFIIDKVEIDNHENINIIDKNNDESVKDIQIGSKVRYKTDYDIELNLIAIRHENTGLFDSWICVNPNCSSKTGKCTLFNCFTEDLEIGWK